MSELEALLAEMVRIDSTNPGLAGGPGEGAFAAWFARRLEGLGMDVDLWDVLPGRPNVVGRLPGSGGGPSLMLLGHLDVVGPWGPDAFEPVVRGRAHVRSRRRGHEVGLRGDAPGRRGAARRRRPSAAATSCWPG